MSPWDEMDEWCKKRAADISDKAGKYIMGGGSLNSAKYRAMLGRHQAYMAMRSYIKGAKP